jgi:hypothetical protein
VRRLDRTLLFLVFVFASFPICQAQSAPQHVRDYVYGPGGRLIMTAEPDPYPPSVPDYMGASPGECAINGVYVSWGTSLDIGTGVSYYNLYKDSSLLGTFSGHSYTDYDISGGEGHYYGVSATDVAGNEGDQATAYAYIPMCMGNLLLHDPRMRGGNSHFSRILFLDQPMWQPPAFMHVAHSVHLVVIRSYLALINLNNRNSQPLSFYPAGFTVPPKTADAEFGWLMHGNPVSPPVAKDSSGGGR